MRFALLLLLSGCSGDSGSRPGSADEGATTWALDAPLARIGGGSGPDQELDQVYGGLLRRDGSLVIGNSGTSELRLYRPGGELAAAAGRRGAGPGEFGSISWMGRLPGDSILAFDVMQQRFSVWSTSGAFARTFRSAAPPGPVRPVGVFEDGTILLAREGSYDPRKAQGVVRDSLRLLQMDRSGAVVRPLGTFPGAEWLLYEQPASFGATQLPFGRTGHLAVTGNHFVYGSSETGRLTVYDRDGRSVRTLSLDLPRRDVSRAGVSSFLDEIPAGPERSALARHYRETPPGQSGTVFTELRADGAGNLWVRGAPLPGADSVRWVVLASDGALRGSLRMHVSAFPLDAPDGRVLIRESDADGVHRVTVHRVLR